MVGWLVGFMVDVRLLGKGNSHSHGARPVHLIVTIIKWIRTSRLSIKNSLSREAFLIFNLSRSPSAASARANARFSCASTERFASIENPPSPRAARFPPSRGVPSDELLSELGDSPRQVEGGSTGRCAGPSFSWTGPSGSASPVVPSGCFGPAPCCKVPGAPSVRVAGLRQVAGEALRVGCCIAPRSAPRALPLPLLFPLVPAWPPPRAVPV